MSTLLLVYIAHLNFSIEVDGGKRSFIANLKNRVTINKLDIFISIFPYDDNSDYLTLPYRHSPINSNTFIRQAFQPKRGTSSVLLS